MRICPFNWQSNHYVVPMIVFIVSLFHFIGIENIYTCDDSISK